MLNEIYYIEPYKKYKKIIPNYYTYSNINNYNIISGEWTA